LIDFLDWEQLSHANDCILFEENLGSHFGLDETALSQGELYMVLTNKEKKVRKGALVAMIKGTRNETVRQILEKMPFRKRNKVLEMTFDIAESFNAKIKAFRVSFRGVRNIIFFVFRLSKIYA